MTMRQLPQEIEDLIYSMAFNITIDDIYIFCVEEQLDIHTFINEHSEYLLDKIDWFDLFVRLLNTYEYGNFTYNNYLDNTLIDILKYECFIKNKPSKFRSFYVGVYAFGGDFHFEYILDNIPMLNEQLIQLFN